MEDTVLSTVKALVLVVIHHPILFQPSWEVEGFVVDLDGIVVTRGIHGPYQPIIRFPNEEWVEGKPLYYDQTHNFSLIRFNPKDPRLQATEIEILEPNGIQDGSDSSFYLSVHVIAWALKFIREGKQVPRGTIQTEFISAFVKREIPDTDLQGKNKLLQVKRVVPEGPGDSAGLTPGDVLIGCRMDGDRVRLLI